MINELNDHGFDDASTERKLAVLNDTYWDVCAREPWPFLEESVALTFNGSSGHPTNFPTDFRAATAMVATAGGVSGRKITFIRPDDFLQRFAEVLTTTGTPRYFTFVGTVMTFYPIPTSDNQVTMYYVAQPPAMLSTDLEATIYIPKAFHRATLVNGALFKLYAMEDDTDIAPTFETYFERGISNMREYCWRQQYVTNDIIHPVDNDDIGLDYFGWSTAGAS
jgi:hypothetical protein